MTNTQQNSWRDQLEIMRTDEPVLYETVIRHFMLTMEREGLMTSDSLEAAVSEITGNNVFIHWSNPNRPEPTLSEEEIEALRSMVRERAADQWSDEKINDLIILAIKKELALRLTEMADDPFTSWAELAQETKEFSKMPIGGSTLSLSDAMGTRVALIRRLLSDQLEFLEIARNTLTIRDFSEIISRVIGPEKGTGKLGGKAAGFILAHDALTKARDEGRNVGDFCTPQTFYIRSDVIFEFLKLNGLADIANVKYREVDDLRAEYKLIRRFYRTGRFPNYVIKHLKLMLESLGEVPLVVRSSSLLEDRLGAAFCGKYTSLFVANQGDMESRLKDLLGAITQVFASVFSPDAIQYRKERGLLDFKEEMACIIQPVVGKKCGRYWLPAFAGVAFGHNEYTWSPRIKRDDGMVRIVAGLGTRAVDRVGDDYPRIFSPGQPGLKTTVQPEEIVRYSQHQLDVIDLKENSFKTIPITELVESLGGNYPAADKVFSVFRDGILSPVTGMLLNTDPKDLVATFDGLLERTNFAEQMKTVMDVLEETWGVPVDVEFAHDGKRLYILQCRPQSRGEAAALVPVPKDISPEHKIFSASKYAQTFQATDIEYIVYVPSLAYEALQTHDELLKVGRTVGELNRTLPHRKFILMGPGRWGSRGDIKLGVSVDYGDINHSRMLIEVARRRGSYVPDVSFGTHFFQDLVEAEISYLPLYPDDGNVYNEEFLKDSPNALAEILPKRADMEDVVRVIHVPKVTDGKLLDIISDSEEGEALAFLTNKD
ncbi:MAG: pyruvate, phosphate dikinase [bacterium]|nr:pyruvate, phosphate dikinase [bacterium]